MNSQIEEKHEALVQLCRQFQVDRLDVFGSAVTGEFDQSKSDLDLLVSFLSHPTMTAFEQYFGFKEALESLFDRQVDLVMEKALKNPFFIRDVNQTRQPLYAA